MTATSRTMLMLEGAARNAVRAVKSSRRTILGFISSQYEPRVLDRWICNFSDRWAGRSRVKGFSGNKLLINQYFAGDLGLISSDSVKKSWKRTCRTDAQTGYDAAPRP